MSILNKKLKIGFSLRLGNNLIAIEIKNINDAPLIILSRFSKSNSNEVLISVEKVCSKTQQRYFFLSYFNCVFDSYYKNK